MTRSAGGATTDPRSRPSRPRSPRPRTARTARRQCDRRRSWTPWRSKECNTARLRTARLRSFHSDRSVVVSSPRRSATVGSRSYRSSSPRLRLPISVPMYQPLNGAAGYWIPPISRRMSETIGTAYHCRPSSPNHSYSGCTSGTSRTSSSGSSNSTGSSSPIWITSGRTSNSVLGPDHPWERQ